ncbi:MAG: radical SAM protein [Candidatus Heimdallarchaeaceae archaeon]
MINQDFVFGPVPSRRLGRSLGVNNIPPKHCTYSCIYCQLGRTAKMQIERTHFYDPEAIFDAVKDKIQQVKSHNEVIDYITFVPDGEPTLDARLGDTIKLIKKLGIPIAVITNSSLIWRDDVQSDLLNADLISFKVDAVSEKIWRKVDRAHGRLKLEEILDGLLNFSSTFSGKLITETMLVNKIDYSNELGLIADFLSKMSLNKAYVAIPTRPPAENWVTAPEEEVIHQAYQAFVEKLGMEKVEYLIGYEGNAFAHTGDVERDLLSIMSVHPMRKDAVKKFIEEGNVSWELIEELKKSGKIIELGYKNQLYYMRKINSRVDRKKI